MQQPDLTPRHTRHRHRRSMHLMLAAAMSLSVGIAGIASATSSPDRPPVLTKSGKRAALRDAAERVLSAPRLPGPRAPSGPTDETKVPHYYGPFPNWANSPFTLPDVEVTINGTGTGAMAAATIDGNGEVTGIRVTNPGAGYDGTTTVSINPVTGTGSGASAHAQVTPSGSVTSITVTNNGGTGYVEPLVAIVGGGATTPATATAYGGVETVTLASGGSGYSFPTVDFDMPDGADGVKAVAHVACDGIDVNTTPCGQAPGGSGVITDIIVDEPGSGYSYAPNVVIRDGTIFEPVSNPGTGAAANPASLYVQTVELDTFGAGYTSVPTVTFSDGSGSGSGATADAAIDAGGVTAIVLDSPGSGYITAGGIKKFQDKLPLPCQPNPSDPSNCDSAKNELGQYLPIGVPDTTVFTTANGFVDDADYYVIALVQHREQMSSSLPASGTLLREYVQLASPGVPGTVPLYTDMPDGSTVPVLMPDGVTQAMGVDQPHFLGPVIAAQKDRPVRVTFFNLLPTGADGDLFIPTDSTMMGAGYGPLDSWPEQTDLGSVMDDIRNPECTEVGKSANPNCMKDSRATLHLHGGTTPWISDGTPHQWSTPKEAVNPWPQGESVGQVPDMTGQEGLGVPDCSGENDGCQTFYWTNQQSARLMFYHDHAFGTTRLNVYLGEAAGYLISDPTEQTLVGNGTIPADQIPLVIQDRTFVPDAAQLAEQDPTWDPTRWGGLGDFWYHHVYMPAQNPSDASGMSAFGRWMYGPWFWPPADPPHGPIANPYYTGTCDPAVQATWDHQTDPFCEPPLIPGTPNIAAGMEQFNDTPLVNGTAYPTLTLEPKAYRFRVLNAANDRFFNLQLYVADPNAVSTDLNASGEAIGGTEVALNPAELAAAQIDPNIFPTPDTSVSPAGPDWILIGNDGGFLPTPAVIPSQPTTWIIDPTVFNVGNVDQHSLLVAPAERTDVIVDFSQYAGKTLILYNDAPAAYPARVSTYDYYTGAPDQYPIGAPITLPGFGPNTRTVMQIKVADAAPANAFDLRRLQRAFLHKANGSGVFESGQHPIIVGQAGYNSAYGTPFVKTGYCNQSGSNFCDGFLRIPDQGGTLFKFNTLLSGLQGAVQVKVEPKAIHDEMNAAAFDEFGRMTANMGLEVVPATPALQNIVLYPYINPPTEMIDATNLPKNEIGLEMAPIASGDDGTQIWRITHNGVDTHPLHFHLYDVQLLNRVTWDNIVSPPDPDELGWKDTVRTSPLEDTIVALRPLIPQLPFEIPNSIRPLNPAAPIGSVMGFNNVDANGNPTNPITNQLVNLGWEYVWHCHILSHEEMDMMRPQAVALPPIAPDGLAATAIGSGPSTSVQLDWNDNSITETAFVVQRDDGAGTSNWSDLARMDRVLGDPNTHGTETYTDATAGNLAAFYSYRIVAENTIGFGGDFMSLTAKSVSETAQIPPPPPPVAGISPPALVFANQAIGTTSPPQQVTLSNTGTGILTFSPTVRGDFAQNNSCGGVVAIGGSCTIDVTFSPTAAGTRTGSLDVATNDPNNPTLTVSLSGYGVDLPAPSNVVAVYQASFGRIRITFVDNSTNETGFIVERSSDGGATWTLFRTMGRRNGAGALFDNGVETGETFQYRVAAVNSTLNVQSVYAYSNTVATF